MSEKKPKTTVARESAAVTVPPAVGLRRRDPPLLADDGLVIIPPAPTPDMSAEPVDFPIGAPVVSSTVDVPHVIIDRSTLLAALQRIADGRLCGCKGDHDREQYDCPKSIARAALEAK